MCSKPMGESNERIEALRLLLRDRVQEPEFERIDKPMLVEPRMRMHRRLEFSQEAPEVETDVDQRCRDVLQELERVNRSKEEFLNSHILHGTSQRFPAKILRKELNRELDRLLLLQVKEQEKFLIKEWRKSLQRVEMRSQSNGDEPSTLYDNEDDLSTSDEDPDDEENDGNGRSSPAVEAAQEEAEQDEDAQEEAKVQAAKKAATRRAFCHACKVSPCCWEPPVDIVALQERLVELRLELQSVAHIDKSVRFVESTVARSVQNGGKSRMLRTELIKELQREIVSLEQKERLYVVDEELHRAYASREPFMETKALHGYKQVQWTHNVIVALESERNRIINAEAVSDLLSGILESMLEGWIFGERETDVAEIAAKNGSGDKDGGGKEDLRVKPEEKWTVISRNLQARHSRRKAVEMKEDVAHTLGETENVLQFGLFSLTLMYFRAMTLLKKSKFEGESTKRKVDREVISVERQRIERSRTRREARERAMQYATERANAGALKRAEAAKLRKRNERAKIRKTVLKAKRENAAAKNLQRLFRGHLGRLAARKWAMLRLEILAQQNLEFASATAIQRVFRGFRGRKRAEDRRAELAEFIAQVRADEAKEEEDEFWRRNPIRRVLRRAKNIFYPPPLNVKELEEAFVDPQPAKNF